MSASFNRAHLLGNIGIINEKAFPNGGMIIEASLATNERYKDKNGEYKDMTQWHRLIFSGNLAELAKKLLDGSLSRDSVITATFRDGKLALS